MIESDEALLIVEFESFVVFHAQRVANFPRNRKIFFAILILFFLHFFLDE
jgi:hypothetical protein